MKNSEIIILDRDGVINIDSPDYIKSAAEFEPLPGSIEAIARLFKSGFRIYVATNQAGLAKGKFDLQALRAMHQKLNDLVIQAGARIEQIFYCPHHPDEHCNCRKPAPGLLHQIAEHAGRSVFNQDFVGDSLKDIQAADAAGANPILVLTGNGTTTAQQIDGEIPTFQDLASYADFRLNKRR